MPFNSSLMKVATVASIGIYCVLVLIASNARAQLPHMSVSHLVGPLWIAEDTYYARKNSIDCIGSDRVTIVGVTWTPATAELLAEEIIKVTLLPVLEVVNANYHPV